MLSGTAMMSSGMADGLSSQGGSTQNSPSPWGGAAPAASSNNPYLNAYAQSSAQLYPAQMAAQQQMGNIQSQQQSGYPAYPNAYGLGNTSSFTQAPNYQANPAAQSAPASYQAQPVDISATDASSRGFNPWSLSGEANARQ
jgi:hypothetical protein